MAAREKEPSTDETSNDNKQPKEPVTPQKIKVGEKEYSLDEITASLNEAEELRAKYSGVRPEVVEIGQHVASYMAQGLEGMKALKKQLEDALSERGVDVEPSKPKADNLPTFDLPDKQNATENEIAIISALNRVAELHNNTAKSNQSLREELQKQFAALMGEIKTTEIATSAQMQVQKETGLSLTPVEIREAIRKTGLSNPVDAIFATPEYRIKALEKLKNGNSTKPESKTVEMLGGDPTRDFDPKGKSFSDLIEYAEQNPEAIKNYIPPWERKK